MRLHTHWHKVDIDIHVGGHTHTGAHRINTNTTKQCPPDSLRMHRQCVSIGSDLDVGEVVFAMAVRSVCGHCVCYDERTECRGVENVSVSRLCLG